VPYPQPLTRIIAKAGVVTHRLTQRLEDKSIDAGTWEQSMKAALAKYHTDAMMAGGDSTVLSRAEQLAVAKALKTQFGFLRDFKLEIVSAKEFEPGWLARAALYAESVKGSYWRGATRMLPLPAMPGDGTSQCLGNCHCQWDVSWLDGEGNANATWILGGSDHCQTCQARAGDWSPLKIRDGQLQ